MRRVLLAGLAILGGCSIGMQPGKTYTSETFTVPVGYQEAYRRADAQPRKCLTDWTTSGNIFTDNKTGVVRVSMEMYAKGDLMRVALKEVAGASTEVTVTVADVGVFNQEQLDAMRRSIESGSPECRK